MSITRQEASALAWLACRMRPHGAPQWTEPDVMAQLARVAHLSLHEAAMACFRAAGDRECVTPKPIGNPTSLAWVERLAKPETTRRPTPPHASEQCNTCSRRYSTEPACCDRPELRMSVTPGDAALHAAKIRALLVSNRGPAVDDTNAEAAQ